MPYPIIVSLKAEKDALEAFEYYEDQEEGLGHRFLIDLSNKYQAISEHPTHYGFIDEDKFKYFRDVALDKFPFVVIFEFTGTEVWIFSIHNDHKNPKPKLKR
ncbi:MAG TPA: type II toxin-antitoxin system RelE/ParE family toxin [Flavisolibacter sp.]|nr:type II toxin-antitoxin system RelE/ParE family toxin [Flavisolibacter sp.]